MQTKKEVYRAVKFRFKRHDNTEIERYMVVKNNIPLFRVNQWLKIKGLRKATTGKEYAKKIVCISKLMMHKENNANRIEF